MLCQEQESSCSSSACLPRHQAKQQRKPSFDELAAYGRRLELRFFQRVECNIEQVVMWRTRTTHTECLLPVQLALQHRDRISTVTNVGLRVRIYVITVRQKQNGDFSLSGGSL
jgi:hypothetical protein